MKLLLASGSETRRRMLAEAGIPFRWSPPQLDEKEAKKRLIAVGASAIQIAQHLAELKALSLPGGIDELVLGSDQVLKQEDGAILGKAGSRAEAEEQLRALSGREHRLHAAASLAHRGDVVWRGIETAKLTMRSFTDTFLRSYLDREWETVRFNVGVYRIEGPGVQLFERVEGSHWAVLGLPLLPLLEELRAQSVLTP